MKIISDRAVVRGEYFKLMSLREKFPRGLTFYKDFTRIPPGEYAGADNIKLLYADFAMGSPVATFTSTSGNFTITSSGYQSTTANDEVLKYLISGNRTAAQETIIIKWTPTYGTNVNDNKALSDTDTKSRLFRNGWAAGIRGQPNGTDSGTCSADGDSSWSANQTMIWAFSMGHTSPYAVIYNNSVIINSETVNDFTNPAWGNFFYVGCHNTGAGQANAAIGKIMIFGRFLTTLEIQAAGSLL